MTLRPATNDDIAFILKQEAREDFADYIFRWDRARHEANLADRDKEYLIKEGDRARPLGYIILAGLQSPHHSVELVRIAVAAPGQGLGRQLLQEVIGRVFDSHRAHRLWLDVFDDNHRARRAYRTAGFTEEGVIRDAIRSGDGYRSLVLMSLLENERRQPADA